MAKAGRKSIPKPPFEWRGWRGATIGGRPILFEARPDLLDIAPPVGKLSGKEWISVAYARRPSELCAMTITNAGRKLSKESKTAPDCAKPLSVGHCINLLRGLNVWSKKPRKSPRQRPK
jgi:hypothetical protein